MKTQSVWLLAAMMAIFALVWGCSNANPNGDPLYRPTEDEQNEKPQPSKGDGGSNAAPRAPSSDAGQTVPSNKLVLSSITPMSTTAGAAATTLTVNGAGFGGTTKVLFGGQTLSPSQTNATTLTVTIPEAALANAGSIEVRVVDGNTTAGPATFTISNAQMMLAAITPNSATAGGGDVSIRLSGSGFVQSARATFNGVPLATTYTSATELSAVIPRSSLATAGTYSVSVTTGTATSSPQTFTVRSAKPVFEAFSPSSAPAGSFGGYITIVGSGFDATTRGTVDGFATSTIVDSPTRMRMYISSADLFFPALLRLRIYNVSGGTAIYADGVGYFDVY